MNRTAEDARVTMAWKQVENAKKAEAVAKAAWVANSTTENWSAWQAAEDRTEAARSVANAVVKQAVMRNDAMRVW